MTTIRKGQAPAPLTRAEFHERFATCFYDPAFAVEADAIARLEAIAWDALQEGRKAPVTRKAGRGFADAGYEVSVQWLDTRQRLKAAEKRWHQAATKSRILIICGSARNDGTCPGEISKTWRFTEMAQHVVQGLGVEADVLDLSLVTSEYGRTIHPCKGCVSSAMPLCHWPCSCYPNHALGQADDWMAEIYERWVAAHGVIIMAPTYWYQSPSPLKLMIDRMVCADGGNPDPTTTHGKKVAEAKAIEQKAGTFRSTWPAAPTAWWCTATWRASRCTAATCATGWSGWGWSMPVRLPSSTATSAITSPTTTATTRWTRTPRCRKRCATSRARWRRR